VSPLREESRALSRKHLPALPSSPLRGDLDSAQEAATELLKENERRQTIIDRGLKANKILGYSKSHKGGPAQDKDGSAASTSQRSQAPTADALTSATSLMEQTISEMDDERLDMQIAQMPAKMTAEDEESLQRFDASLEAAIAAKVRNMQLEAVCKMCKKNKVAFKGLICHNCQKTTKTFCKQCSEVPVLSKGDICSNCGLSMFLHRHRSSFRKSENDLGEELEDLFPVRDVAIQSSPMTSDAHIEAVLNCYVCRINSVLAYGTVCGDCHRMGNVVKKRSPPRQTDWRGRRPPPREIDLREKRPPSREIDGRGVELAQTWDFAGGKLEFVPTDHAGCCCARCGVVPVAQPGEVCEACLSKAPWRGVRIGGGYDILKLPDTGEQVEETVRADSAHRLDPTSFYAHGAPTMQSSPDRYRVGSYTNRSPRQTVTHPRSPHTPLPGAQRGNRHRLAVDAAALVRASLSAMTHSLTAGAPAGAPQGEGEPSLYRVMVPSHESRPLSAPGTARGRPFA